MEECVFCKGSGKIALNPGQITCLCKEDKIPDAVKKLAMATYNIGVLDGADKLVKAVICEFAEIKQVGGSQ